jgi:hypothetical protein
MIQIFDPFILVVLVVVSFAIILVFFSKQISFIITYLVCIILHLLTVPFAAWETAKETLKSKHPVNI